MPAPPKYLESKIVHNASVHVLRTFDSIPQSPTSRVFPNEIKLKPNEDQGVEH
jgi:hypothetical protein